jgi:N-methylhydantoinase A
VGKFVLGIDVGGTFTDGVALNVETGELMRAKVSTTPDDQSEGTVTLFREFGIGADDVAAFHHGATVGLNAVLTRNGVRTALLCTSGFRDLLDIGELRRPWDERLYDPNWIRPHQERPLVHRRHRREISERLLESGAVHEALDEERARKDLEFLRDEGIESVAICLINGYVSDSHERRLQELVAEIMPDAYVQVSSVQPRAGEYKRTFAVVLDAYAGPPIVHYLTNLRDRMHAEGYKGELQIMQMSGGLRTLSRTIDEFPALTMSSGPVAGILGAEFYARVCLDTDSLACVDIGGTSTDIGFVHKGRALLTDDWEVDDGMPLGVPTVDVLSIGAGGGSLLHVDEVGTLRVGPDSAGAVPGPACYGRGGTQATVTDCYSVLGLLHPDLFLGGRMDIDVAAARAAIAVLAEPLHSTVEEVAQAAYDLVNRDIANAVRKKGFDRALNLDEYAYFAYGGAGPLHAVGSAQALGMRNVVVPYFPGGFSAFGMLASAPRVERAIAPLRALDVIGVEGLREGYESLERDVTEDLLGQGLAQQDIALERSIYVMYEGQSWPNRIPLASGPIDDGSVASIRAETDAYYDLVYGYTAPDLQIIVTSLAVTGQGPAPDFRLPEIPAGVAEPPAGAIVAHNDMHYGGKAYPSAPFYRRDALVSGNRVPGPAIIDDALGTVWVPPDSTAEVDTFGTITITWERTVGAEA